MGKVNGPVSMETGKLKESALQLQGWQGRRRVVIVRRRLNKDTLIGLE